MNIKFENALWRYKDAAQRFALSPVSSYDASEILAIEEEFERATDKLYEVYEEVIQKAFSEGYKAGLDKAGNIVKETI